jgi:hypothetical protein
MSLVLSVPGSSVHTFHHRSTPLPLANIMGYQYHKNIEIEDGRRFMRPVMSVMCIFFRARTLFIHLILFVILCPTPEAIRILVAKISKYQPQSVLGL